MGQGEGNPSSHRNCQFVEPPKFQFYLVIAQSKWPIGTKAEKGCQGKVQLALKVH